MEGLRPALIAVQLTEIAARLDAILGTLKDDVAALKTIMFGTTSSNQASPPAPSTPLTLTDYGATSTHISTKSTPREPNFSTIIITLSPPSTPATILISAPKTTSKPAFKSVPKPASKSVPKPSSKSVPKPARNAAHRHHKPSPKTASLLTKNRTDHLCPLEFFPSIHTRGSVTAHQWVSEAGYPVLELLIAWENYELLMGQLPSYRLEDKSSFGTGSIDTNPIMGQGQTGWVHIQLMLCERKGNKRQGLGEDPRKSGDGEVGALIAGKLRRWFRLYMFLFWFSLGCLVYVKVCLELYLET